MARSGMGMHSDTAGRLPSAVCRLPSHAFTLIEMMVVIGLFMLLMGLTVGALMRTPRTNALVAAQQVVGDLVRQARHTARSSGGPVVLKLSKDKAQITGAIRTVLWQYSEGWLQPASPEPEIPGRTGQGLWPAGGVYDTTIPPATFDAAMFELKRPERLDTGRRITGFALSVAVRMDPVAKTSSDEPLVMVGAAADLAGTGEIARSFAGLRLEPSHDVAVSEQPYAWRLIGWVGDQAIDSITHATLSDGVASAEDPAHAVVGGRWEEFTLLWDGRAISLLRDGRQIAERALATQPAMPTGAVDVMAVVVGYLQDGPDRLVTHGTLDDVRLERIGSGLATNLPGDMRPSADQTITCFPDGRVLVDGADNGTITVQSRNDPSDPDLTATITITTGGAVTVEKIIK